MTISDAFSTFLKLRRIVALVSVMAGGASSYIYGPTVWHKAQDEIAARSGASAKSGASSKSPGASPSFEVATNADGVQVSDCSLGAVSLTNHLETCVSLGNGKDCILTPKLIDSRNITLTLTVETKGSSGRIQNLSVTEVTARLGKPLDVAVGEFSFNLTPEMDTK